MGLKILHSADWHLEAAFSGFRPELRSYLKQMHRTLPERVGAVIAREDCDLVLLAGDLFDSPHPGKETVDAVKAALEDWKIPVCIAPGNHDYCCPGSPWLEEVWPENVHIFTEGLTSVVFPELDCRVYGAGYRSMDCPALLEGFQPQGQERYHVAVLHADPTASHSPYCPVTEAQLRQSGLDYVALGHIHQSSVFRAGETRCAMAGSPMGRSWEEDGVKGVYVISLDEQASIGQHSLGLPYLWNRYVTVSQDPEADVRRTLPPVPGKDVYRLTLLGQGQVDAATVLEKFPQVHLELCDRTEAPYDLWEDVGEDSFRGVFFGMLQQAAEENPNAILAAEICHRLLRGREVTLP